MNNTKTTTLAMFAIFMTATLVVGTAAGSFTTATPAAYAANNSGNTITAQINTQDGTQSGWDNTQEQESQNTICTHPSATCVSENEATATTTTPVTGTGTLEVIKVIECKRTIISTCPPASDFTITVTGNNPTPRTFQGSGTGTLVTLGVGAYKVNEEPFLGFDTTFSADCTGTIAPGDQKTCIVTNTQQEP